MCDLFHSNTKLYRDAVLLEEYLLSKSIELRKKIVNLCIKNGGHIASSLSCVEILTLIYYSDIFNFRPSSPNCSRRDRFILSKGHAESALFTILADKGFFPEFWLAEHYRQGDCRLGGHPDKAVPGVEISTGALGHGLNIGVGMAMAAKMNSEKQYYIILLGDAECTEGSIWEAALFAAKNELSHLVAVIDRNKIGSIDFTEKFTSLNSLAEKWKAFNWDVRECDGHDCKELFKQFFYAKNRTDKKPLIIIANTIKGKGISFIENQPTWHVKSLVDETRDKTGKKRNETMGKKINWNQMRDAFISTLYTKAVNNHDIIFLSNEYGAHSLDKFRQDLPVQFINAGISEQNIISVAAGMALEGKKVFIYSIASFINLRCFEQTKLDICVHKLPVVILGVGTCFAYSEDGPSHHATEDISLMRTLSGITIFSPSDLLSCEKLVDITLSLKTPCYIRLDRTAEYSLDTKKSNDFSDGFRCFDNGKDVLLISTGFMTHRICKVSKLLYKAGISTTVIDLFRLKPVSLKLVNILTSFPHVVSIEEHTLNGGLGSIIAELIVDHGLNCLLKRVGITDENLYVYGVRDALHKQNCLDVEGIMKTILLFLGKQV